MSKLIGISGKRKSGKDIVGQMIKKQYPEYEIKKFADKLKEVVCILTGCIREQLENEEFKNKEIGPEWEVSYIYDYRFKKRTSRLYLNKNDISSNLLDFINDQIHFGIVTETLTYRKLLQLLGTDACRDIIHPNIWVNALFKDYSVANKHTLKETEYPNWIITDVRFPNEIKAIKDKGGIVIRLLRETKTDIYSDHISETILDSHSNWDYVINNNSTLEDLEEKLLFILSNINFTKTWKKIM